MKLISHGLQGGKPFAKVEFTLEDIERLTKFLFFAPGGAWVGDLRRELEAIGAKMRQVSDTRLPPPAADPDAPWHETLASPAAEAWQDVRPAPAAPERARPPRRQAQEDTERRASTGQRRRRRR